MRENSSQAARRRPWLRPTDQAERGSVSSLFVLARGVWRAVCAWGAAARGLRNSSRICRFRSRSDLAAPDEFVAAEGASELADAVARSRAPRETVAESAVAAPPTSGA